MAPVAEVLDGLDLPWAVAGALAAYRYRSDARFTTDLDLLTRWDDRLPEALEKAGYDVRVHRDPDGGPHLALVRRADQRIDLLFAVTGYQDEALTRGAADHVLTVEDVLIHKLIAWRPRDRDDIHSILAAEPALDDEYLGSWIAAWDVTERWRDARRES